MTVASLLRVKTWTLPGESVDVDMSVVELAGADMTQAFVALHSMPEEHVPQV